ncbi:ornithine cyclodeaminase [Corynebacterium deserti GIMN1.010]|uniref:Ornithine cyclodeaminase n=1 Tax=Corynebacterium deserti GIMN1.010 TaxID=931089 RepID=A0A0M4CM24_9CORY|nr:tyramine oxidase subunit B [Corynebacterium deserti]ALC05985.1 ornithine cyclodeaminase [Corynebacterium deserti GIMN1.010]
MTSTTTSATNIDFLFLNEPDMIAAGVKDIDQCVDVMEETLVLLAQGDYKMAGLNSNSHGAMITFPENPEFEGMPKDGPDRRFMAMPAYLGGRFKNTGVKWYGSNAENKASGLPRSIHTFVLNDTVTGAPKAIMSANLLSAYRTGAVPGVGVKHLALTDSTTLAVIGPGVMAKTITEASIAKRPGITTIKVKGRSERGINAFATWALENFPEVEVIAVDTEQEAVKDADIVIAATTTDAAGSSAFPYFKKEWLKPGALLLLPAAARFDDEYLLDDARLVVDYMGLYDAWAEEYGPQAYQLLGIPGTHWHDLAGSGKLDPSRISQIGDICSGKLPGRTNDEEIILYSVGGMPVEDVAWATQVYENALEKNIGTSLNLWETPDLA